MRWDNAFYELPFILVAVWAVYLAGRAWKRSRAPGSLTFALLMLSVAVWLFASAGSAASIYPAQKLLWARMVYFSTSWMSTLWFVFVLEFAKPGGKFLRRYGPVLWVIPTVTLALVITNELHGWLWRSITPAADGSGSLFFERGWWYYLFIGYSYFLLGAGLWNLVEGMARQTGYRRRQMAALAFGMVLPWMANLGYVIGWVPQGSMDITPFAFAPAGLLYAWSLFQLGLFEPEIGAREVIFEHAGEGYVALDGQDLIVDVNSAAREVLGLPPGPLQGCPARYVLARWTDLLALLEEDKGPVEILCLTSVGGEAAPVWEAALTPWYRRAVEGSIRFLVLHDVSARKRVEKQLGESESRYRLLVNASPVGMVTIEKNNRISFASPEVYEQFGIPASKELVGSSIFELVDPQEHAVAQARLAKLWQGERIAPYTYSLLRADGSSFCGELVSTPLFDEYGKITGMLSVVRDVTIRKRMETSLQNHLEQETFTNDLLQILYHPPDVQAALDAVLERAGQFVHASRMYLCQDSQNGEEAMIAAEWCGSGLKPRAREAPLLRYAAIPAWKFLIETRGMLLFPRAEVKRPQLQADEAQARAFLLPQQETPPSREMTIPPDIVEYMDAWGALSLAVFPVYGQDNRVEGFLAVEDCHKARTWTVDETRLLWNVTKLVSGALAQREVEEAEEQQRAMSEALQDTAQAMNSTLHLEEVFDRILANIQRVAPHDAASVAMIEDNMVHFVRWRGFDHDGEVWLLNNRVPLSSLPTYRLMVETRQPVIISDTWADSRWFQLGANQWIRSYLGVPISIQNKVVGFLNLDSAQPEFFNPRIAGRLTVFADQSALAIQNARLYQDAQRRVEEMSTLYHIGLTLTAGLEMNQVLINIFEQCRQVLPIDVFLVALYDAETTIVTPGLYYRDGGFGTLQPRSIVAQPGMAGAVIQARRTIYIGDTLQPEQTAGYQLIRVGGQPTRAYVGVPMIVLDSVLGVVSMQSYEPYAYTAEQIRLLETIASQAAIAVQNARLYDQMRQMAITDAVTGLNTRRHFTIVSRGEVERAHRYHRVVSVLMVDIDFFKRVNDTFGHSAGDQVLQVVARVCGQALRVTDIVGRWGGEEFAVFLPEADIEGAAMIAERIRRMVEETTINLPDGKTTCVTVSLGVASLNETVHTLEALVDCADQALYQAKQSGRNCVRSFSQEISIQH